MRHALAIALTIPAAVAGAPPAPFVLPLVEDGRPVAGVVVAPVKNDTLAAAVADLRAYVKRITGADLDVREGTVDLPGPTLHIGETALYPGRADPRRAIRTDGFLLAPSGEDLLLAGTIPEGTANGIWTILQDQFGIRWYYPGPLWEIVPERRSLAITVASDRPDGARILNPSFQGRHRWGGSEAVAHARRMRLTQPGVDLHVAGTGHSIAGFFNPETYGASHPEYFAWYDGRRHVEPGVHPCFTHPDMAEVFMRHVRAGGRSFGVNDNLTACRCERCLAVDGASPPYMGMWNASESYFALIARVAAQTAEEFPGQRLGVFAYQLTNTPPRTVPHIGANVDVTLCQDTSQNFDPAHRARDQAMSAEWVRKAGGVRFYDYIGINYWT
ncbi:MAG: DUF4838 domain-containing protein, partial [Planctomycetes bacterium]|nr:DUF4838 domain-containing protein [Planctomycetota bacterium]